VPPISAMRLGGSYGLARSLALPPLDLEGSGVDQLLPCSQLVQVTPARGVCMMAMPRSCGAIFRSYFMSMYRKPVNKSRSAHKFKRNISKTKAPNMRAAPMRGGIRL